MQNFSMNDFAAMMQQFGLGNGGLQKYLNAYQQLNAQGNPPQNMFQAYKQFRKNLGLQGEVTEADFNQMQNQMSQMPKDQLDQMKSMLSQQASAGAQPTVEQQIQNIQSQLNPKNGGF